MSSEKIRAKSDNKLLHFIFTKYVEIKVKIECVKENRAQRRLNKKATKYVKNYYKSVKEGRPTLRVMFYDSNDWFVIHSAILNHYMNILPNIEYYLKKTGLTINIVLLRDFIKAQCPTVGRVHKLTLKLLFMVEKEPQIICIDFDNEKLLNKDEDILFSTLDISKEQSSPENL